jgi:murein L,D-transpeptidase YafK
MPSFLLSLRIAIFVALLTGLIHGCSTMTPDERAIAQVIESIEQPVLLRLQPDFQRTGLQPSPASFKQLALLAFKQERRLEVWSRADNGRWVLFKTYPFTAFSGRLGPKLREGDRQIPEGIYRIDYLNPYSSYHLSLKVNYPNDFDKAMGELDGRQELGGEIFFHGNAVTVGCIPIGDVAIEELFYMVHRAGMENVTVIIAPADLRRSNIVPAIAEIGWETALYQQIAGQLQTYQ